MKKKITIILLFAALVCFKANAESFRIGLNAGVAIPNENISQFSNEASERFNFDTISAFGDYILNTAASRGYSLSIKGRIELSDRIDLVPSIGITRFNEGLYDVVIPVQIDGKDTLLADVRSVANVVPIELGINAYLARELLGFIGVYGNASLSYNYLSYSCDYKWKDNIYLPFKTTNSNSRFGYSVGAGVDIDLYLITLNLGVSFHNINTVKGTDTEKAKNYGVFSVGVVF